MQFIKQKLDQVSNSISYFPLISNNDQANAYNLDEDRERKAWLKSTKDRCKIMKTRLITKFSQSTNAHNLFLVKNKRIRKTKKHEKIEFETGEDKQKQQHTKKCRAWDEYIIIKEGWERRNKIAIVLI